MSMPIIPYTIFLSTQICRPNCPESADWLKLLATGMFGLKIGQKSVQKWCSVF